MKYSVKEKSEQSATEINYLFGIVLIFMLGSSYFLFGGVGHQTPEDAESLKTLKEDGLWTIIIFIVLSLLYGYRQYRGIKHTLKSVIAGCIILLSYIYMSKGASLGLKYLGFPNTGYALLAAFALTVLFITFISPMLGYQHSRLGALQPKTTIDTPCTKKGLL